MIQRLCPAIGAVISFLTMLFGAPTIAADIEPAPKTYLADRAEVIDSATEHKLIGLLQELEQKTKSRVIVVTVNTTGDIPIEDYALKRARTWKFGPNRQGASILIVIAVKDRRYRIETGYKQEGVMPDARAWKITNTYFKPHFKANRFGQGILEGTAALAEAIAQDQGVTLTGMPRLTAPSSRNTQRLGIGFIPILFIFLLLGLSRGRSRSMLFWGLLAGSMMSGRRGGFGGGGFSGGGFGGGGFGSFGGGGGGGFGGGGVSGGW